MKNRERSDLPEAGSRERAPGPVKARAPGKYRLEPLEPRVLLSADPLAMAVAGPALAAAVSNSDNASPNAVVQQHDAGQAADTGTVDSGNHAGQAAQENLSVAWPAGWQANSAEDAQAATAQAPASDKQAPVAATESADSEDSPAAQFLQAAAVVASQEKSPSTNDSSPVNAGDGGLPVSSPTDVQLPRAPPADDQFGAALVAVETKSSSEASPTDSANTDEGGLFASQAAPVSEVNTDASPRAPPGTDAASTNKLESLRSEPSLAAAAQNPAPSLTDQALAPVLEQALAVWSAAGLTQDQIDRLAKVEVHVADLPDGVLGWTEGNRISIDPEADGYGWFIDPTPGVSSEFAIMVGSARLVAARGSEAFGRMDLLTVLVHELGHEVGLADGSGPAVMDAFLGTGQRVLLGNAASFVQPDAAPASGPMNWGGGTLAAEDGIDSGPITFTIVNHGGVAGIADVHVSGAGAADGFYDDVGTLVGLLAGFNDTVEVGIDAYTIWNLTGLNAGTVTVAGFAPVSFGLIENLTGAANANDAFIVDDLGVVTGTIDDRGGNTGLDIGGGSVVAVAPDGGVAWSAPQTVDVITGNADLGTSGTLSGARLWSVSVTGASLFVGSGGSLNGTGSGIVTTGATGFSATGANVTLARVTAGTESFTGVQASVTSAALVGVASMDLQVSGTVKLNQTSRTDGERIDWATATTVPSTATNQISGLSITKAQQLSASGSASLNIGPGNLVAVIGTLTLEAATADVVTGNTTIGTLNGASVFAFTLSGANLFVGTGGAFGSGGTDRSTIDTTGAVGFSVTGASFSMASVKKLTDSFTAVEIGLTNADLIGASGVDLRVTGSAKLNQTSRSDGQRIDWATASTTPAGLLPTLTVDQTQRLSVVASGSLDIGPGNVVAVVSNLTLEIATADVVTGNAAITGFSATDGTIDGADVLALTISGANLFLGTGAQLNGGRNGIDTPAGAVGFLMTGASLGLAVVSKGTTSFVGAEASVANAQLLGIDAIDLRASGTIKLNKSSVVGGPRIDWDSATTVPSTAANLLPALAITSAQQLSVVAGGSLNIGPGNVVAVIPANGLTLDIVTMDVVTGNAALGVAGTLAGANVLSFTVTNASLFVGTGAAFGSGGTDRSTIDTSSAVGFSVAGASFSMASVTKGTESFTGVQVSVTNAALVGVAAVDLQVS
ncbi:MAG TPA: LEPR-XLL domain-containing protein, partial [Opitutaceae bacterium]|nr:LEPR-XLL domain-containing protein [Opitutaceae bacterium]